MTRRVLSNGLPYYSPRGAAMLLSVNESTIKRWADSGKIQCFRTVGNHRRFSQKQIEEFLARCKRKGFMPIDLE